MRTMLLSFKQDVFDKIKSGRKIFEHRKVFPSEPIKAYIYVSRPTQAIKGILYLDNKVNIEDWKNEYYYDLDAVSRIDDYLKQYRVAVQIKKFQNTTSISLKTLRDKLPNFLIPQMYYFIDDSPLLSFLEDNLIEVDHPIIHNFDNINSNFICTN